MSLRSFFRRSQFAHSKRRANAGRAIRRLRFETCEDRRMLSFTPAVNHPTVGTPSAIVTADFNNDGMLDLATCANALTGSFSVLLGNGAGGFGEARRTIIGTGLSSLAVADFNNDTRPDLMLSDGSGIYTLIGNGDGTFQPAVYTDLYGKSVAAVGIYNDGNIDVVVTWIDGDWATHVQMYRPDGQGGFAAAGWDVHYWGWSGMAAVDLNNDGMLDVVTGEGVVFLGSINGSLQFDYEQQAPLTGGAVATGDFTGDGNADVIVAGNSVAVLRGRGDGSLDAPIYHSAHGTSHTAIATADFNADGKLDAVVTDRDKATLSVMLGHGDGSLDYVGAFATGEAPSSIAVGDFNRDGLPDVAVANVGSRDVSVLLNAGDWESVEPFPGDYNFNGTVDAADFTVWKDTNGSTSDLRADGNGDGRVDAADYDVWKSHFGQILTPGAGSSIAHNLAEPAAIVVEKVVSATDRSIIASFEPDAQSIRGYDWVMIDLNPKPHNVVKSPDSPQKLRSGAESIDDRLLLLLAKNKSGPSSRIASKVTRDSVFDDHRDEDAKPPFSDAQPFALAQTHY